MYWYEGGGDGENQKVELKGFSDWISDEIEQKDKDSPGWMNDGTTAGIQPECTLTATLLFKILTYFSDELPPDPRMPLDCSSQHRPDFPLELPNYQSASQFPN